MPAVILPLSPPSPATASSLSPAKPPGKVTLRRKPTSFNASSSSLRSPPKEADAAAAATNPMISVLERLFRRDSAAPPPEGSSGGGGGGSDPVRVAYQGVRGSYCQEAAAASFTGVRRSLFPCGSAMEDAFTALESGAADASVVPAENSLDGPIDRNLDLLLRHSNVRIVGELVLPVNHCLMSLPGGASIRRVASHPQALSHCAGRIRDLGVEVEEVPSAAEAALYVAENRIAGVAVIGSEIAGAEFGLRVLERNFQDRDAGAGRNYNRFFRLGLASDDDDPVVFSGGGDKTTVAFTLEKGPSELFRAMWVFESRGVRVLRVDHRPNRAKPLRVVAPAGRGAGGGVAFLDYVFVMEVQGGESDRNVASAVLRLREFAGSAAVLGSYFTQCR